jgi:outer membrane protein OmpA-like peptidoglycan-associated protein
MYWPESTRNWLVTNLTANGLSSSKPIVNAFGQEDMAKSQRVEFKVRTKNAAAAEF